LEALRTPDDRFVGLPDFPFAPHYTDDLPGYDGLRMHYLDEGPRDARHTFLCLHGEPTWSYLYRKMLPVFVAAGHRVVAPDFFGFGRSDKPVADAAYTFGFHRGSLVALIERLDLRHLTLVVQDWGGLLGLTLPADNADRIARLVVMNTALATGHMPPSKGFVQWRDYIANTPELDVAALMKRVTPGLSDACAAAYAAPFPDGSYQAGVRRFPAIVPTSTDAEGADIARSVVPFWTQTWSGPTFMAIGARDPVLGPPVMNMLRQVIRGCPEPMLIEDAGHFVQEAGDRIAPAVLEAFGRNES